MRPTEPRVRGPVALTVMIDWITNNFEVITRWILRLLVGAMGVWLKFRDAELYEEIQSGNSKGEGVVKDFATLKSKGFDVRIKTGIGSPRGKLASSGAYQNTQTLLVKRDQKVKALDELYRQES